MGLKHWRLRTMKLKLMQSIVLGLPIPVGLISLPLTSCSNVLFFFTVVFWFDNHFGNNPGCYSCWCDCFFVLFFFPFSLPQSKPMLEEQRNIVKYIIEGYKGNKVSGWVATCGTKSLVP